MNDLINENTNPFFCNDLNVERQIQALQMVLEEIFKSYEGKDFAVLQLPAHKGYVAYFYK